MISTDIAFGSLNVRPWVTIELTAATDQAIQPEDQYVDTSGCSAISSVFQVVDLYNCNLYLETADTIDGAWRTLNTISRTTPADEYATELRHDSEEYELADVENRFHRYLRYRVGASGSAARICFRWVAVFKRTQSKSVVGPDNWRPRTP